MTLKVWRGGGGRLHAACTSCFSSGTPASVDMRTDVTREVAELAQQHREKVAGLMAAFREDSDEIVRQHRDGSLTRGEAAVRLKSRTDRYVGEVLLAEKSMPDASGGTREVATRCPWCGVPEEVVVENLPADALEITGGAR